MSNTGGFWNGQPALSMYAVLLKPVAARARGASSTTPSTCSPRSAARATRPTSRTCATIADAQLRPRPRRARLAAPAARRSSPTATARPRCASSRVPATVIHGAEDKLVRPSGGRATAKAIPGAKPGRDRRHGPRPPARRVADRSSTRSPTPRPARRQHQHQHDDEQQDQDHAAGDRAALPLIRPEARVRAVARVAALGRFADPVVVVAHAARARSRSARPSSVSRWSRCWM